MNKKNFIFFVVLFIVFVLSAAYVYFWVYLNNDDLLPLPKVQLKDGQAKVIRLDEYGRHLEYFAQAQDGRYIVVYYLPNNGSHGSFRFLIGDEEKLERIPIEYVERYRDGGTTTIMLLDGQVFHQDSPFVGGKTTFNGVAVTVLNRKLSN